MARCQGGEDLEGAIDLLRSETGVCSANLRQAGTLPSQQRREFTTDGSHGRNTDQAQGKRLAFALNPQREPQEEECVV